MRQKLLVTGANGFLGSWLVDQGRDRWQIYGTYRTTPPSSGHASVAWIQADFQTPQQTRQQLSHLLQQIQPDAVIHLAAESNTSRCQQNPQAAALINVQVPEILARLCYAPDPSAAIAPIPLVFTSTGMVFDGTQPPYRETDAVGPLNHYAQQKVAAEQRVLAAYPQAIIARMPLMFSWQAEAKTAPRSSMAVLDEALVEGKPIKLFTDEIRTPVSAEVAAIGLLQAVDWARGDRHRGLIHLGGRTALSRYDLGRLIAQHRGYSSEYLLPARQRDVPLAAPRPQNVSLDSSLAFSLGYNPPPLQCR